MKNTNQYKRKYKINKIGIETNKCILLALFFSVSEFVEVCDGVGAGVGDGVGDGVGGQVCVHDCPVQANVYFCLFD